MQYIPILMSASVSPHGMKGAMYSDEEREQMYISTLQFYLKNFPQFHYVFVENSGWDLSRIRNAITPPY